MFVTNTPQLGLKSRTLSDLILRIKKRKGSEANFFRNRYHYVSSSLFYNKRVDIHSNGEDDEEFYESTNHLIAAIQINETIMIIL